MNEADRIRERTFGGAPALEVAGKGQAIGTGHSPAVLPLPFRVRTGFASGALLRSLGTVYQPHRIPGAIWLIVHSGDEVFPRVQAARWHLREPGFRPAGYQPRRPFRIPGDHVASGPEDTARLGRVLMGLAEEVD